MVNANNDSNNLVTPNNEENKKIKIKGNDQDYNQCQSKR